MDRTLDILFWDYQDNLQDKEKRSDPDRISPFKCSEVVAVIWDQCGCTPILLESFSWTCDHKTEVEDIACSFKVKWFVLNLVFPALSDPNYLEALPKT